MSSSAGRAKRDREKARQEKAAIKRTRKLTAGESDGIGDDAADSPVGALQRPQADVLADLASLHQRFEDGQVDFDDFEDSKQELMAQLDVG